MTSKTLSKNVLSDEHERLLHPQHHESCIVRCLTTAVGTTRRVDCDMAVSQANNLHSFISITRHLNNAHSHVRHQNDALL